MASLANVRNNLTNSEIFKDFIKKSRLLRKSNLNPLDFFETLIVIVDKASVSLPKSKLSLRVAKSLKSNYYTTLNLYTLQRLVQSAFSHINKYGETLFEDEFKNLPDFVATNSLRQFINIMKS